MASRTIRFEDNTLYDLIHQTLGAFPAGSREREAVASSAFRKVSAIGVKTGQCLGPGGRFEIMTLLEKNGPQEVVLLESERDMALEALRAWPAPTFDVPLKDAAIALLTNAKGSD